MGDVVVKRRMLCKLFQRQTGFEWKLNANKGKGGTRADVVVIWGFDFVKVKVGEFIM